MPSAAAQWKAPDSCVSVCATQRVISRLMEWHKSHSRHPENQMHRAVLLVLQKMLLQGGGLTWVAVVGARPLDARYFKLSEGASSRPTIARTCKTRLPLRPLLFSRPPLCTQALRPGVLKACLPLVCTTRALVFNFHASPKNPVPPRRCGVL